MFRYLVTGSVIINDLCFPDGSLTRDLLGGSIYAVNGILPYTDDVLFLAAAGEDFVKIFGPCFERNGLTSEGIEIAFPKTHHTLLKYQENGEWSERSLYGADFERKYGTYPLAKAEYVIAHGSADIRGIYFESSVQEAIWEKLEQMRAANPNAKFMVEISAADCRDPERKEEVLKLIKKIDIYSLNLPEAGSLFDTQDMEEMIHRIMEVGKPCFFRLGRRGSMMIQDQTAAFVPAVESENSVDATGCGNCSTGAALYGFAEGFPPLKIAAYANVAAGVNARQFGPFPYYSKEIKAQMKKDAEELYRKLREVK